MEVQDNEVCCLAERITIKHTVLASTIIILIHYSFFFFRWKTSCYEFSENLSPLIYGRDTKLIVRCLLAVRQLVL